MAYLDDWYSTLARNLKVGNKKRFFWKGYEGAPGDMEMATSLFKDVLNAFTGQGGEEVISNHSLFAGFPSAWSRHPCSPLVSRPVARAHHQ